MGWPLDSITGVLRRRGDLDPEMEETRREAGHVRQRPREAETGVTLP